MTETTGDDRSFPPALAEVARIAFEYGEDGEGVDFEPYDAFDSAGETTDWIRSWTGNDGLDGDAYRVFGQDGTGGLAALWLVRPGRPLAEQPVVFLGSEGESGLVAGNLSDLLWVLADGFGPLEAAVHDDREPRPAAALADLAGRHATTPRRPAREIIAEARAEFATFSEDLDALCR
ncbi:SMI1/KNR4 family protein [Kitasatospora sp. NPDC047058]|uniref:SMI1/KNR4 family protein n=1 Tax=Kitasatospora sp. NPDC047058 TaxID=3155620 RepID=UPI003405C294